MKLPRVVYNSFQTQNVAFENIPKMDHRFLKEPKNSIRNSNETTFSNILDLYAYHLLDGQKCMISIDIYVIDVIIHAYKSAYHYL